MYKDGTKIALYSKELEEEREFSIEHAENLLNLQISKKITGWILPENSKFELGDNGKLIERSSKGSNKKSDKQEPTE